MTSDFTSPDEFDEPQSSPESTPRQGRARERQRRRREKRSQQTDTPARRSDHLTPAGRPQLRLPSVKLPSGAKVVIGLVLAVVVVVGVVIGLRQLKPPEAELQPNALWIGTEWTYEEHEPEAIADFVEQLHEHDIGTVYAWVSWLQEDGTWRGAENFAKVRVFANQLKAVYPEVELHGWISFPANLDEDGYRLDDEELQQNIADFSASVVGELGYDGIFLNVEPVWDGDESFLALLRKVRTSVGDEVPVSAAIPPDWSPEDADIPVPPLIVPGTVWAKEYKQSVALLTDHMAIMAYNSGLSSAEDYEVWMAYQVATFADAISELGEGTNLLIGIPTYDEELPGHDPEVESVPAALRGLDEGLSQAGEAAVFVQGVAIYAGWTTDEIEWQQFNDWLATP